MMSKLLLWVTRCIYQIDPPHASLDDLIASIEPVLREHSRNGAAVRIGWLRLHFEEMAENPEALAIIMLKTKGCISARGVKNVEERQIDRRSFIGLFLRRCILVWTGLDIIQRNALVADMTAWANGEQASGSSSHRSALGPRAQVFDQWQRAMTRGDYWQAKSEMLQFFDHGAPGSDIPVFQHAFLNLAHFHMRMGSYGAAHVALRDAVQVARVRNDRECMAQCESLAQRLQRMDVGNQSGKSREEEDVLLTSTATLSFGKASKDLLWTAQQDLREGRLILSIIQRVISESRLDPIRIIGRNPLAPPFTPSHPSIARCCMSDSAIMSELWNALGDHEVAKMQRDLGKQSLFVATADEPGVKMSMIFQVAFAAAERGDYSAALSQLFVPDLVCTLSLAEYQDWHEEVLRTLWLRAYRRGDRATLQHLRAISSAVGERMGYVQEDELADLKLAGDSHVETARAGEREHRSGQRRIRSVEGQLKHLMAKSRELLDARQPALALDPLMKLLTQAKQTSHLSEHRAGIVLLAEIMCTALPLTLDGLDKIEDVLVEALADNDFERRGEAQWVYARAILSVGNKDEENLTHALKWLKRAEEDFRATSTLPRLTSVLYYQTRLLVALQDPAAAGAAIAHATAEREELALKDGRKIDEITKSTLDLAGLVGARAAK